MKATRKKKRRYTLSPAAADRIREARRNATKWPEARIVAQRWCVTEGYVRSVLRGERSSKPIEAAVSVVRAELAKGSSK